MEARERMLQEQERKLDDRLNQAKAADEAQKSPAAAKPGADPSGLKNVVIMYEAMKPKEAARVFDRLPLEVLLSVVTQMNARKMSEVLAMMTPENAEKLTVALARRAAGQDEAKPAASAGASRPASCRRSSVPPSRGGDAVKRALAARVLGSSAPAAWRSRTLPV
jgi:flagellar motility protein MotE (MotC chaperone)